MSNTDSSSYNLRWNEVLQDLEYTVGLNWVSTGVFAGGGINQLTGDVTAGPGSGSQAATVAKVGGKTAAEVATAVDEAAASAVAGDVTTSGLTMDTARLLGRTTASTGAIEEITVGTGLSLSAGTLTATGGTALTPLVQVTSTTDTHITSNTYATTGFTASFAASNALNRIRLTFYGVVRVDVGSSGAYLTIFVDNATNLAAAVSPSEPDLWIISPSGINASFTTAAFSTVFLPNDTMSHTYTIYSHNDDNSTVIHAPYLFAYFTIEEIPS